MPEQLTKHPEVTLQVLKSAGAKCGEGAPQEILKACSAERFCKLPGGEVCIYGLPDALKMTQISAAEWQGVLGTAPPAPSPAPTSTPSGAGSTLAWAPMMAALVIGFVAGWLFRRRKAP